MTPVNARQRLSLTPEQVAKRAGVTPAYLKRLERHGGFTYIFATKLAKLYGVPIDIFLNRTKKED